MPLFGRSETVVKPPSRELVIESPVGSGEINFDDEETAYIEREWGNFASLMQDTFLPEDKAEQLESGMIANYLLELARTRLRRGEFEGAATTCIKAVGLASYHPFAWLMLAEVYATYGDRSKATRWLKKANEVARSGDMNGPLWKEKERAVRALL